MALSSKTSALTVLSTLCVLSLTGCAESPSPSITTLAVRECLDRPPLDQSQCIEQYELDNQKWVTDCRVQQVSAVDSISGNDELLPWCTIHPNHSFWIQIRVVPGATFFENLTSESACGSKPRVAVDGKRVSSNMSEFDRIPINRNRKYSGRESIVTALMTGELAVVQNQARWPKCYSTNQKVKLTGLSNTIGAAERWVLEQQSTLSY